MFLRVHPTGKMVLSLTTESDGNEARYAQLVASRARRPGARRQGRARRHRPVRRRPRLQHGPSTRDAGRDRRAPPGRSWPRRQLLAGVALETSPDTLRWVDGAFVSSTDPSQAKTIADLALYAHGTGALPPGVEGGLDAQTVYKAIDVAGRTDEAFGLTARASWPDWRRSRCRPRRRPSAPRTGPSTASSRTRSA